MKKIIIIALLTISTTLTSKADCCSCMYFYENQSFAIDRLSIYGILDCLNSSMAGGWDSFDAVSYSYEIWEGMSGGFWLDVAHDIWNIHVSNIDCQSQVLATQSNQQSQALSDFNSCINLNGCRSLEGCN